MKNLPTRICTFLFVQSIGWGLLVAGIAAGCLIMWELPTTQELKEAYPFLRGYGLFFTILAFGFATSKEAVQ